MAAGWQLHEDNPILSINVKVWKLASVIFPSRGKYWRLYAVMLPVVVMNAMQFVYLVRVWKDLTLFILNAFFTAIVFEALFRTCVVIINRDKFEAFISKLSSMYKEIEECDNVHAQTFLKEASVSARKISIFNLTAAVGNCIALLLYPLLCEGRMHPFGVALPGVDMTASPVYEIFYIIQLSTPLTLPGMYMTFLSLFASFAMFGKCALVFLQNKLQVICEDRKTEEEKYTALKYCIAYYSQVEGFIKTLNSLLTYVILLEFIIFGTVLCMLLFCMNLIENYIQTMMVIVYILTLLYVTFTYYWHANEMLIESIKVAEMAYEMPWYDCDKRFRGTLLMFMTRAQKPLQIMVGNMYPMSLATFQSLLNTSYSYFTMLRGTYN